MNRFWDIAWRLWFVQASWNREGMQSLGLSCAALPEARARGLRDEALRRFLKPRLAFVNTNPYLAGIYLGATLTAEEEQGEAVARRLAKGLSRHLGAVGDGLFWQGLRPAFAYGGLAAGFLAGPRGLLAAWLAFALLSGLIRLWGLREGLSRGMGIVDWLDARGFPLAVQRAQRFAWLLLGAALALGFSSRGPAWDGAGGLACAAGALLCGALAAARNWPLERALPALALITWVVARLGSGS